MLVEAETALNRAFAFLQFPCYSPAKGCTLASSNSNPLSPYLTFDFSCKIFSNDKNFVPNHEMIPHARIGKHEIITQITDIKQSFDVVFLSLRLLRVVIDNRETSQ